MRNANPNTHQSEMPKFGADGLLTEQQIGQVADYVMTLADRKPDASLPGAAIFADNCALCHGAAGEGTKELGAPPLDNQIWLYKGGRDAIVAQVTRPRHGSMPAWSERLEPATIKMLAVYVHTLGGGR